MRASGGALKGDFVPFDPCWFCTLFYRMFFVICWLSVCICRGGYYPPVAFICILYRCLVRFISSIPAIICILILLLYMPKRTTSWQGEGGKNKTAAKVSISLPLPASRFSSLDSLFPQPPLFHPLLTFAFLRARSLYRLECSK